MTRDTRLGATAAILAGFVTATASGANQAPGAAQTPVDPKLAAKATRGGKGEAATVPCPPATAASATFADVQPRATGTYRIDQKDDSVQALQLPGNPSQDDVRKWLGALDDALLSSIRARFSPSDMAQFASAEQSKCSGNIFCQMAFRQQAIAVLMGPGQ